MMEKLLEESRRLIFLIPDLESVGQTSPTSTSASCSAEVFMRKLIHYWSLSYWPLTAKRSYQTDGSHTRDDVTLARSTRAQQIGSIFAKRKDVRKHSHLRFLVTATVQRSLYNSSSYSQPHLRAGSNKQRRWGRGVNYHWSWNINYCGH